MVCTLIGVVFLAPVFAKLQSKHEALVTVLASAFAVRRHLLCCALSPATVTPLC